MESLIRFERWVVSALVACWLACVIYAVADAGVKSPVDGLGPPKSIIKRGGSTMVTYEVPYERPDASSSLDIRLQIKGYKRPAHTWGGFYMKSKDDFVEVIQGRWCTLPGGGRHLAFDPTTVSVTHTMRQTNWSSVWNRFRWQQAKRKQAANARIATSTYR